MALPLVDRLRADLDVRVALVHSGLGDGERADEWRRIRAGDVDVVVGTRLAVLSPLGDPGLVIVDEEHDPAYKSDRTPRLQARDVAIRLASLAGAACVLGSATPAVETLGRALDGTWSRIRLPSRPIGEAPRVEVVDLRAELAEGNRGLLSRPLDDALTALDTASGEQAILVLNRRGTASVVLCRDCGHVQACPDCERPLVYHQAGTTLRCHHCGRATPLATRCPACASPRIRYLGGGTERVEREVRGAHPNLRVARLDRDVAERRGAAQRVIDDFVAGRTDVLVGTSLVAKGLDVPSVTLVGVVSSDVALNLPDERAAERTFQLLSQAVGRAGRGDRPGRAILQTYQPDHPAITAVASGDAEAFYASELAMRRRFASPPFGEVIKLTVALGDRGAAEAEGEAMATRLRDRAIGRETAVAGPAPAYIARRNDRWRFNVVLRGADPRGVLGEDPGPPWSVDVDPEIDAVAQGAGPPAPGSVGVPPIGHHHATDPLLEALQAFQLRGLQLDRVQAVGADDLGIHRAPGTGSVDHHDIGIEGALSLRDEFELVGSELCIRPLAGHLVLRSALHAAVARMIPRNVQASNDHCGRSWEHVRPPHEGRTMTDDTSRDLHAAADAAGDAAADAADATADATADAAHAAADAAGDAAGTEAKSGGPADSAAATAASIFESLRDAVDDLADRAGPTVKEFSAKAAEIAAVAADKAGPFARKAGEATADASGKLADKSRGWATDIRSTLADAADSVSGSGKDAADTSGEAASQATEAVGDTAAAATDAIEDATDRVS